MKNASFFFSNETFIYLSRDADGDVDNCPMWTFPTVRPSSMNKLQKGYTHTDSEVSRVQHPQVPSRSFPSSS